MRKIQNYGRKQGHEFLEENYPRNDNQTIKKPKIKLANK